MKKFTKEIKIALVAILSIIIIYMGITFLKGMSLFDDSKSFYVALPEVSGLAVSSEVLADGFPVGVVKDMSFDYSSNKQVVIHITVDKKLNIPAGSYAELSKEMLGATKLNLVLADNNLFLNPGDTISGGWRLGALDAASSLMPKLETLMPKLYSIMYGLSILVNNPSISTTLDNMAYLTNDLKTTTGQLNNLLGKEMPKLVGNANTMMTKLGNATEKMNDVDFKGLSDNTIQTLTQLQQVTSDLKNLLTNREGTYGKVMYDASLYNHLDSTIQSANALMNDLREHPKRYVHFSVFGKKDKAPQTNEQPQP